MLGRSITVPTVVHQSPSIPNTSGSMPRSLSDVGADRDSDRDSNFDAALGSDVDAALGADPDVLPCGCRSADGLTPLETVAGPYA